jgi:hypothetical protein
MHFFQPLPAQDCVGYVEEPLEVILLIVRRILWAELIDLAYLSTYTLAEII